MNGRRRNYVDPIVQSHRFVSETVTNCFHLIVNRDKKKEIRGNDFYTYAITRCDSRNIYKIYMIKGIIVNVWN